MKLERHRLGITINFGYFLTIRFYMESFSYFNNGNAKLMEVKKNGYRRNNI